MPPINQYYRSPRGLNQASSRRRPRAADTLGANRHERRRAKKMRKRDDFYTRYFAHLPRVPLDAPLERGRLYHRVVQHDEWCVFFGGKECNCSPIITRHIEPPVVNGKVSGAEDSR